MNQALALEIMLAGENVMLTGPAGSGKTFVLNDFIRRAKKEGKSVAVTATTGLAATHLGGSTIHSWSGIGIHDSLPSNFFKNMTKGRIENILKADVLIIDEISMLHDYRFDLINEITKQVRKNKDPFGGLQVILCGDFFQLPPVNRSDSMNGGFVVNSEAWSELDPIICYLNEQFRQKDNELISILSALRAGDIRRHHAEKLLTRLNAELSDHQDVAELHTTNINVDNINNKKLDAINEDAFVYEMQTTGSQNYAEALKRSCLAPENLILKKGSLVMCIKNSPDKKYANGSLGTVVDFETLTNYPIIKLRNGREITMQPDSWELRDGDKKRAGLTQIPLRLAWAITIHKSQGMTLDAARINLGRAFVEGMGYVALSRVRDLETLSLTGLNNMALRVSRDALEIDELFLAHAKKNSKRFKHLLENSSKKEEKKDKPKTPWSERLAKIRESYPNAFKPWSKKDDDKLLKLFNSGKNLETLCNKLHRQPGGVSARLKKHLGDDVLIKEK